MRKGSTPDFSAAAVPGTQGGTARPPRTPQPSSSPRPPAGRRRVILHCVADAFFCQVERQRTPSLYGDVPALAVFQRGDGVAAAAGAELAGARERDSPAAARRELRAVGGALVRVPVTDDQRVQYRPYVKASKALHEALCSKELADVLTDICAKISGGEGGHGNGVASPSRLGSGVAVEKASIDEAYVQLPSGCNLERVAVPCAIAARHLVKRKTGLTISVGAAWNKTFAKFASASAKPDGIRAVVPSRPDETGVDFGAPDRNDRNVFFEDLSGAPDSARISESALLRSTPASRLRGLCGEAVREKMKSRLNCLTVFDVANLGKTRGDDDTRSETTFATDRLVACLGIPPKIAARAFGNAKGECDDPVSSRDRPWRNKSVGVHFSLSTAPRRMPRRAFERGAVSATLGKPGGFDPVRVGDRARVRLAVDAMSRDLVERVCDECEASEEDEEETGARSVAAAERRFARWPRAFIASVTHAEIGGSSEGTVSRRAAFPDVHAPFAFRAMEGETARGDDDDAGFGFQPSALVQATASAARASFDTIAARLANPSRFVAKLSLVALDIRPVRRLDGRSSNPPDSTSFFSRARETRGFPSPLRAVPDSAERGRSGGEPFRDGGGAEPLEVAAVWRALARGEMRAEDVHAAKRRRVEWLAARRR